MKDHGGSQKLKLKGYLYREIFKKIQMAYIRVDSNSVRVDLSGRIEEKKVLAY